MMEKFTSRGVSVVNTWGTTHVTGCPMICRRRLVRVPGLGDEGARAEREWTDGRTDGRDRRDRNSWTPRDLVRSRARCPRTPSLEHSRPTSGLSTDGHRACLAGDPTRLHPADTPRRHVSHTKRRSSDGASEASDTVRQILPRRGQRTTKVPLHRCEQFRFDCIAVRYEGLPATATLMRAKRGTLETTERSNGSRRCWEKTAYNGTSDATLPPSEP